MPQKSFAKAKGFIALQFCLFGFFCLFLFDEMEEKKTQSKKNTSPFFIYFVVSLN